MSGCCDPLEEYGEINGVCPDCGETTSDGETTKACGYSPVECETCGYAPCDGSC